MFSKLYQVTRDGAFVAPPAKLGRFKNISMMEVRTETAILLTAL